MLGIKGMIIIEVVIIEKFKFEVAQKIFIHLINQIIQ